MSFRTDGKSPVPSSRVRQRLLRGFAVIVRAIHKRLAKWRWVQPPYDCELDDRYF